MTPAMHRMGLSLGVVIVAGVALYFGGQELLGVHRVTAGAEPLRPVTEQLFEHQAFDELLSGYVRRGRVRYPALVNAPGRLRGYVGTLERYGPRNTPELEWTEARELAYYINAYNALTLLGVVEHWPIDSVHDVRGPIEPTPGFGFFWAQRFTLEEETVHLYELEHERLLERFGDARIHAAINCASASCPPLRDEAYRAPRLDAQLDEQTRAFCSDPQHVRVDEERQVIVLSSIFDWFRSDFEAHAQRIGAGDALYDFIIHYAAENRSEAVRRARRKGYETVFAPYDWSLNAAEALDRSANDPEAPLDRRGPKAPDGSGAEVP
jgi:hypothetical protein